MDLINRYLVENGTESAILLEAVPDLINNDHSLLIAFELVRLIEDTVISLTSHFGQMERLFSIQIEMSYTQMERWFSIPLSNVNISTKIKVDL